LLKELGDDEENEIEVVETNYNTDNPDDKGSASVVISNEKKTEIEDQECCSKTLLFKLVEIISDIWLGLFLNNISKHENKEKE